MRTIILPLLVVAVVGCRSHKEADTRLVETMQTQTVEAVQTRTDSREKTQTERTETADSITWTATADSIVQTQPDGTRRILHHVRWTRTAYRPEATATATTSAHRTDTASVAVAAQTQRQAAAQTHTEASRGNRSGWLSVALALLTIALIAYGYWQHKKN